MILVDRCTIKLDVPSNGTTSRDFGWSFWNWWWNAYKPISSPSWNVTRSNSATCSFMVFFSSTMSAVQYMLLGMEHTSDALIFTVICFLASIIGIMVVQRAIGKHGRASLIGFPVGTVMVLSTVLLTSFGALNVWRDYKSGKDMGFK